MIATKQGSAIDLADNIADLMLTYLNKLNCDRLQTEPDNRAIQSDAKFRVWLIFYLFVLSNTDQK